MGWLNFFTDGTLLHATDSARIALESASNADIGIIGQLGKGLWKGSKFFGFQLIAGLGINCLCNRVYKIFEKKDESLQTAYCETRYPAKLDKAEFMESMSWQDMGVLKPIKEELLYRGLLQTAVWGVQETLGYFAKEGEYLSDHDISILKSPIPRILLISTIFALMHFRNAHVLGKKEAAKQVLAKFIYPVESILRETTGLFGAIAAHCTMNSLGYLLHKVATANKEFIPSEPENLSVAEKSI